jgi:hypothetical protein
MRQAATLLRFAGQTKNSQLAAVLLEKAADLNDKLEGLPLPEIDVSPKAPDVDTTGTAG